MNQESEIPEKQESGAPVPLARNAEEVSLALTFLGTASLGVSVFFDWSFLLALGLTFGEVQTTIADHARSALLWLPSMFVVGAMILLTELLSRRFEGHVAKTEPLQVEEKESQKQIRNEQKVFQVAVIVALAIASAYQLLVDNSGYRWFTLFACAWLFAAINAVAFQRTRTRTSARRALAFILVPALTAVVGSVGYLSAEHALTSPDASWRLSIEGKHGEPEEAIDVALLRRFTSAAVLVDIQGTVRVIPESSIKAAVLVRRPREESFMCTWLHFKCIPSRATTKTPQSLEPSPAPPKPN